MNQMEKKKRRKDRREGTSEAQLTLFEFDLLDLENWKTVNARRCNSQLEKEERIRRRKNYKYLKKKIIDQVNFINFLQIFSKKNK